MISNNEELDQTTTWALALVSLIFILISLGLEKIIHKMGTVYPFSSLSFFFFFVMLWKFFLKLRHDYSYRFVILTNNNYLQVVV
jgi:hypothetical protein